MPDVNDGRSLESTSKSTKDDLANDLLKIIGNAFDDGQIATEGARRDLLMQQLLIYITQRDEKILQHGIDTGRSRTVL